MRTREQIKQRIYELKKKAKEIESLEKQTIIDILDEELCDTEIQILEWVLYEEED